ncbi:MAG: phage tail tube protein [Pseudomonadota bacterium]
MTAGKGPLMTLSVGGTPLAALSAKSFNINKTPVDTTTDGDATGAIHWRTKLVTVNEFSMTVSGIVKSADVEVLRAAAFGDGQLATSILTLHNHGGLANPATIAGTFLLTDYSENGEIDGVVEFSGTIENLDAPVYTAASA